MWSIKKIPSNLSNWISFLRKMHFSNESRKRKTNCSWPLTLIMQTHDHFRLLRQHYSESPDITLSNDIWYRCVAHGFITFYFLIFYRWSISLTINFIVKKIVKRITMQEKESNSCFYLETIIYFKKNILNTVDTFDNIIVTMVLETLLYFH